VPPAYLFIGFIDLLHSLITERMKQIDEAYEQVGDPGYQQVVVTDDPARVPCNDEYGEGDDDTEQLRHGMKEKIAVQ